MFLYFYSPGHGNRATRAWTSGVEISTLDKKLRGRALINPTPSLQASKWPRRNARSENNFGCAGDRRRRRFRIELPHENDKNLALASVLTTPAKVVFCCPRPSSVSVGFILTENFQ